MQKKYKKILILAVFLIIGGLVAFISWKNGAVNNEVEKISKEVEQYAEIDLSKKNTALRIQIDSIIKSENELINLELENLDLSNVASAVRITTLEEEAISLVKRYANASAEKKEVIELQFRSVYNEIKRLQNNK